MDLSIDQKIQAAIEPLLKRIMDLQNDCKVMGKMLEDINNGHMPIKNQKPNNTLLDKNAEQKPKIQNKPKPKQDQTLKPIQKQNNIKKTGDQMQNNPSIINNPKDKNKKNGQQIKNTDKTIKPIPINEKLQEKQTIIVEAKIEAIPTNDLIEAMPLQEEKKMNMQNLIEELTVVVQMSTSNVQTTQQVKMPLQIMEIVNQAPLQTSLLNLESHQVETIINNQITAQIAEITTMVPQHKVEETSLQNPIQQSLINTQEKLIPTENINEPIAEQKDQNMMIAEEKVIKEQQTKQQNSQINKISNKPQTIAQPMKNQKPTTKATMVKNGAKHETNPIPNKKINQTSHNDKNKPKMPSNKTTEVIAKKQVEPIPVKVQKKPVVNAKLKTETKQVKPAKGKEVPKPISSKSHINSPKKGPAMAQVKSEIKNNQNMNEQNIVALNAQVEAQKMNKMKIQTLQKEGNEIEVSEMIIKDQIMCDNMEMKVEP